MSRFVVGKIIGCFGIKGYLKIQPLTHTRERLVGAPRLFVGSPEGASITAKVEDVILRSDTVLMKLSVASDRTSAEKIVGQLLLVEEADVAPPPLNEYFVHDVIGCEVWIVAGDRIGVVHDVYRLPAQDVWVVKIGEKECLVPAVREFIEDVDVKRRKITLKPIPGLLNESEMA